MESQQQDPRTRLKQALASGQARLQPLTFPQREVWETSAVAPGDPANNVCSFFEVRGPITPEASRQAIRKVIERQEVMRTSILPGKERPLQIIRSTGDLVMRFRELSESETRPEAMEEIMASSFREPFDLVRGPLYRMDLFQRGPEDFLFVFTTHHAISDGWTLGAFVEDLCGAYILGVTESGKTLGKVSGVRESMSPVPMTYSDWGAAERARWTGKELERHVDFWRPRLDGSKLLFADQHSAARERGPLDKWVTSVPAKLADSVRELARKVGATQFSTFLAAFQLALYRWSNSDDIVVGSPVANRNTAAVKETMGYFSSVVPLRGQVDRDRPFSDRLRSLHEDTMDAFAHAMPFAELAKSIGASSSRGHHTLFDVRFAFQNHPVPDVVLPGIATKLRVWSTGTARFDIACEMTEDAGGFEVVWLHRPSVISLDDIKELDQLFRAVLTKVCHDPDITPDSMTV